MGEWIWVMIPLVALMIPIVALFSSHQQKMAQILHQSSVDHSSVDSLRQEISELKSLIHSQMLAIDSMAGRERSITNPPPAPTIADRLTSGS